MGKRIIDTVCMLGVIVLPALLYVIWYAPTTPR